MGNGFVSKRRRVGRVNTRREMNFSEMTGEARRPNRWLAQKRTLTYLQPADERQPRAEAKDSSPRRPVRLAIDVPLLLAISTMLVFGLLMVFSASWEYSLVADGSPTRIVIRQLMFVGAGSAIAFALAFVDYHRWQKLAVPAMIISVLALLAVLLVGEVRHNAVRTFLGGSIQPSELAKLVVVIYLAVWLHAKRDQLSEVSFGLLPLIIILGLFSGLIYLQPDLSAAATIILLGATLFFLAGGDLKQILFLVSGILLVGFLVVSVSATGSNRWSSFLPGLIDPTQASYHVRRSFEAFVKGGWFGVGIGKADTKLTGLPVPHTDSIFAVVGEEMGVIGATFLVILFGILLWRGLTIARRAPDGLGMLLAAGLSIWLVLESYVNMAVMVGLMPFAGNALPFMSAGGSSLIVSMAAIGLIFNICRQAEKSKEEEERAFSAVVNLRRRDWRGRESRPRRPAGSSRI